MPPTSLMLLMGATTAAAHFGEGVALLAERISHRVLAPISASTTRGCHRRGVWRYRRFSCLSWGRV